MSDKPKAPTLAEFQARFWDDYAEAERRRGGNEMSDKPESPMDTDLGRAAEKYVLGQQARAGLELPPWEWAMALQSFFAGARWHEAQAVKVRLLNEAPSAVVAPTGEQLSERMDRIAQDIFDALPAHWKTDYRIIPEDMVLGIRERLSDPNDGWEHGEGAEGGPGFRAGFRAGMEQAAETVRLLALSPSGGPPDETLVRAAEVLDRIAEETK